MYLPLMFKGAGMRCLIVGGGEVAWRKLEILLAAECAVTVIAPRIQRDILASVRSGCVLWMERAFRAGDCRGYRLVIAATGLREINQAVHDEAECLGIPVNVVDNPDLCTVIFPAIWRRGSLTIAAGTEGAAPFMAAAVRDRIAGVGAALVPWIGIAARFRAVVRSAVADPKEKGLLYRQFVDAIGPGTPPEPPDSDALGDWLVWIGKCGRQVP